MWFNKQSTAIIFLFVSTFTCAQVNRYFVSFKDKAGTIYSISDPIKFLSQKAIDRRVKQNLAVIDSDFPVNQNYVTAVQTTGAKTFYKSRWLNGILVQCDLSLVGDIEALAIVKSVELVAPGSKLLEGGRKQSSEDLTGDGSSSVSLQQLSMIGIDSMHQQGYRGEGITIAVIDAGFPNVNSSAYFQDLISENRIDLNTSYDFVFNTSSVFQYDQHGAKVFSVLAGYKSGVFAGSAYKANFQLYVTEDVDTEYEIEEYNWLFAAERADSAGVDIISTSLGYTTFDDPSMNHLKSDLDGNTAIITRAAQYACDRGVLVVSSAGNEGGNNWGLITPPADAQDVLTIANVNVFGERSQTSSRGPTADGRIKPDLAAMGSNVAVVLANGSLAGASGTSYSAPLITGLAAGLWQRYPDLTNKEIVSVLKHTASQSAQPDIFLGWGIPNYIAVRNYLDFKAQKDFFEVYPNPFDEFLTVRPKNPEEITECTLEIHDLQGRLIETRTASFNWLNPSAQANFSNLAQGLYIFKISFQQKLSIVKVVKR
jgi:serine protease AprX